MMKILTKRSAKSNPVEDSRILQRTVNRLLGFALVPKGVYRFSSFEEADRWMTKEMARTRARRNSKTS